MIVVLNEEEIHDILQEHILTKKLSGVDVLVVNRYSNVRDEDQDEVEYEYLTFSLEMQMRPTKEGDQ